MVKVLAVIAAASLVAGVSAGAAPARPVPTRHATVGDDFFTPGKLTIRRGSAVVWRWTGSERHTVTEIHGHFGSKPRSSGTYRHRFTRKGAYSLYCRFHPDDMRMTVVVR